ncbi:MAG: alpha-glucosidase/alpha-galactosidase, partial [Armatimonadota bacterium]
AYYKFSRMLDDKYHNVDYLASESPKLGARSVEYCSYILEAHQTNRVFKLNGNVRNDGYITNLPEGCCVEVPVYVDRQGFHPARVGNLPPQCAALNLTNVIVQTLAVEAGLAADPEHIVQAVALDPLTSTRCTLSEVRAMVSDMLEAQREWLPQFAGQSVRPTPAINIAADVQRVEVPLDPALAIAHRFGDLATRKT